MNREIKFRAWSKIHKRWETDYNDIYIKDDGSIETSYENMYTAGMKRIDVEINLYSGLKDREKKDIYEGNIVQLRYWHNNPPSKRPKQKFITVQLPVIFSDGQFKPNDQAIRSTEYGTTYGNWWEHCAVVGDIFQNPELITQ